MMSQSLFKNQLILKRCTGLTLEQFNELTVRVELLWDEAEEKRLSGLNPNRKRAIGAGHPYTLKTIQEKLFGILLYYKIYPAFWLLGLIVGLDASNVCRLIKRLRPLVEKSADPELEVYLKKVNQSKRMWLCIKRNFMIEKTAHPEGFIILTQRLFRKSRSRISVTEHNRREIALNAVKEAVKMLEQEFGDNLVSVTAFGSFAKGRRFHKVDVLIVLKELGNGQGARQRIAQITAERVFIPTFSKSHVLCNVLIYTS